MTFKRLDFTWDNHKRLSRINVSRLTDYDTGALADTIINSESKKCRVDRCAGE